MAAAKNGPPPKEFAHASAASAMPLPSADMTMTWVESPRMRPATDGDDGAGHERGDGQRAEEDVDGDHARTVSPMSPGPA